MGSLGEWSLNRWKTGSSLVLKVELLVSVPLLRLNENFFVVWLTCRPDACLQFFLEAVLLLSAAAALNCVSVIRELICELPSLWMLVVSGYLLLWLPFPCVAGNRTWSTAEWDSAPTPTHVHQDGWGLGHSVTEPPSVTQQDASNSEFRVCTP